VLRHNAMATALDFGAVARSDRPTRCTAGQDHQPLVAVVRDDLILDHRSVGVRK
jgi:hypothetical protein